MVAPLIAAAARAAVKAGAKKAAKAATRKVGRLSSAARKAGDEATIARKRYYRASERYLKKAEQSTGTTAARYRYLAKQSFEDALSTYSPENKQRYSKPIQRLANEFGYDLERERRLPDGESARAAELARRERQMERVVYARSDDTLESTRKNPDKRREAEARAVLRSSELGRRIIGGYVDVWRDEATYIDTKTGQQKVDTSKIFKALYKYFGVSNVADLVEAVEKDIGEDLYSMGKQEEVYETVKLRITKNLLENEAVA